MPTCGWMLQHSQMWVNYLYLICLFFFFSYELLSNVWLLCVNCQFFLVCNWQKTFIYCQYLLTYFKLHSITVSTVSTISAVSKVSAVTLIDKFRLSIFIIKINCFSFFKIKLKFIYEKRNNENRSFFLIVFCVNCC